MDGSLRIPIAIVALVLGSSFSNLRAEFVVPSYDMDSLVKLSDSIVEATVGQRLRVGGPGASSIDEIKIVAVFKGRFSPGEVTTVADLDSYVYVMGGKRSLAEASDVLFFLNPRKEKISATTEALSAESIIIPASPKLILPDRVLWFSQEETYRSARLANRSYMGSGRYFAAIVVEPPRQLQTKAGLLSELERSLHPAADFTSTINGDPKDAAQLQKMIELYRLRSKVDRENGYRDLIAEGLAVKIGQMADAATIDELRKAASWYAAFYLENALTRGEKRRDYVLRRVLGLKSDRRARQDYSSILSSCVDEYLRDREMPSPAEATFMHGVARATVGDDLAEIDRAVLLEDIRDRIEIFITDVDRTDDPRRLDLNAAAEIFAKDLKASHGTTPRYRFDEFCVMRAMDPGRATNDFPQVGQIVTVVEPLIGKPTTARPADDRRVHLKVAYCAPSAGTTKPSDLVLVLRRTNARDIELHRSPDAGDAAYLNRLASGFGSNIETWFVLDQKISDGDYEVFCRLKDETGKSVGDGFGFKMHFPQAAS